MSSETTSTSIEGPAGRLETQLDQPSGRSHICAVLCHPHPQYGGSMHDMVLGVLAGVLLEACVTTLRFNYRGVGASDGHYDGGVGEVDDLLSVVEWLRTNHRDKFDQVWLGGYSFGAGVAWQALEHLSALDASPDRVLLISPPLAVTRFRHQDLDCPVDAFAGDRDEFVDQMQLANWDGVRGHVIAGTDHFFMGAYEDLSAHIRDTLATRR
ncbi:MAG: CocE/NonD family hydrolase [Pseudomonadales bacterium]|jgi:hypothetical protein|nr:CocE/NonD family hydrolase [Pseudomonadales bacterium]MDP6470329.1 CocE/NonD family hydrolase [Pseudomonadales bacterium]MDP6827235.1 CocE/NonD family hydrolase [Pseudomonadales bacterium]MDP6972462.1 CocE/NonD family hydrolase [Pseudomonadales bacterium]|tara:strand:- start:854 stop:1486 length:633 start_codon:yes stop_codon:yes gene_type:complete